MEPTGVDVDELIEFWTYPERDTPSSVHMKSTRYSLLSGPVRDRIEDHCTPRPVVTVSAACARDDPTQTANRGSVTAHAQGVTCGNRTREADRSVF